MSSEDFVDLSDFLKTYLPSLKNSLAAGSRAMKISSPGRYPACWIASRIDFDRFFV